MEDNVKFFAILGILNLVLCVVLLFFVFNIKQSIEVLQEGVASVYVTPDSVEEDSSESYVTNTRSKKGIRQTKMHVSMIDRVEDRYVFNNFELPQVLVMRKVL